MHLLITGGAGFIGSNATAFFIERGHSVVVLDNCVRPKVEQNLSWLVDKSHMASGTLAIRRGDIRDWGTVERVFAEDGPFDGVLHLAAQVAVTTSVQQPRADFEVNALGTLNLLEASRHQAELPCFVYASTNKVYGKLSHLRIADLDGRDMYQDAPHGVAEDEPLDFYSPYGCSKGAADQYVRDYARIFGLPSVVLRQSCIYGPRQFGGEDQGWVAWFTIAAATGQPITIFGDGKQTRDLLWVDDLILAYDVALRQARQRPGTIYNIGGGPLTVRSLHDIISQLGTELGRTIPVLYGPWRPGDQQVFVSDIRKASQELGWAPTVLPRQGVQSLLRWVQANESLFSFTYAAK